MVVADNASLPLAIHAASASPHEVTLVGETLLQSFVAEQPERLIGDKAYDSDPLDAELAERGIESAGDLQKFGVIRRGLTAARVRL